MSDERMLSDLEPGDEGIISSFEDIHEGDDRLRDMGLNDGTPVRLVKYAPLGDPLEIKVRGFYLSIRKSAAKRIRVRRRHRGGRHEEN